MLNTCVSLLVQNSSSNVIAKVRLIDDTKQPGTIYDSGNLIKIVETFKAK